MRIEADSVLWSTSEEDRVDRPLLVMLHGHGLNETVGFDLRHALPVALVLASIRAPLRTGTGYSWFPLDASLTLNQLEESTDAVLDWLDRLPPAPSIGLLGFSQGAATAFQVLRRRPDAFAYAVNLAGFVVPFPAAGDAAVAGRRPPTFWGRGERDRVIPSPLVTSTRDWLRRHTELTEKIYPNLGHNVSESELADLSAFLAAQIHP